MNGLWTALKLAGYSLLCLGVYWVFVTFGGLAGGFAILLIFTMSLGFELSAIKEKLDNIQWALDDLRRERYHSLLDRE